MMLNIPQKSSLHFANNTVILHAFDNVHSFADSAKTILSGKVLQMTKCYLIIFGSFLIPRVRYQPPPIIEPAGKRHIYFEIDSK
jgi:hypothetical protein